MYRCAKQHSEPAGDKRGAKVDELIFMKDCWLVSAFTLYRLKYAHVGADTKARGGRIVAVGTTSVRTLESWARSCTGPDWSGGQASGVTKIFITPGFDFKLVDLLITNFHLPKSTLMMLVSAFAGYEHIRALYRDAMAQHYRFFSYGDAMLLARPN